MTCSFLGVDGFRAMLNVVPYADPQVFSRTQKLTVSFSLAHLVEQCSQTDGQTFPLLWRFYSHQYNFISLYLKRISDRIYV